jgi:hypothetical protein
VVEARLAVSRRLVAVRRGFDPEKGNFVRLTYARDVFRNVEYHIMGEMLPRIVVVPDIDTEVVEHTHLSDEAFSVLSEAARKAMQ